MYLTLKILALFTLPAIALSSDASLNSKIQLVSDNGIFRVIIQPELSPLKINEIHDWHIQLNANDGTHVENAVITFKGGMPAHDHGLPTSPKVTKGNTHGKYIASGIRFHMPGIWEIIITIRAEEIVDSFTFNLTL